MTNVLQEEFKEKTLKISEIAIAFCIKPISSGFS